MNRCKKITKRRNSSVPQVVYATVSDYPSITTNKRTLSGWPMLIGWAAMLIFALHACTHMVAAGDTWVALACGRHFIHHGVDTIEPFSANSHKPGPTPEEIKTWPGWAQWITNKVGLETMKALHPTGWINQNWLTHVIFYLLVPKSSYADGVTFSSNALVYWKFAIYILTAICVYYTGRLLGVHPALSAAFACFAMFTGRSFFDIRPAGFSNLLTAVFLLILVLSTYRNILYIWLIVPLTVFWCNVHGGYIFAFIMLVPFVIFHLLTSFTKKRFVSIGRRGLYHTIAAGAIAFVAVIIFNPFHLTNLTHTFVISVSKHAERWRDIHEWKSAFDWTNRVGTGFPFLLLFISSIGLLFLWLFSRRLRPRLLQAPKNELETQMKRFKKYSMVLGYMGIFLICCIVLVSLSLLSFDILSFLWVAVFVVILMLSVFKSVHFIYLATPLTLLAVWSGNADAGYDGRYFFPFIIVPAYVMLHVVISLLTPKISNKLVNIFLVLLTALASLLLMMVIFNPFGFREPVWHLKQFIHLQRVWQPEYEQNIELSYNHLFSMLYVLNIASIIISIGFPYIRTIFRNVQKKMDRESAREMHRLPQIDPAIIVISALTIYMAVRSRRFIPIAAIVACPVLAMFTDQILQTVSASRNFHAKHRLAVSLIPRHVQFFLTIAGVMTVLFFGTWWGLKFKQVYLDPWPSDPQHSSIFMRMTASDAKPFYATKFIKDNKLEGKMLNYWTEGGFITWSQVPDLETGRTPLQLFMDGRAQAAYDRKAFDDWSYVMAGGRPSSEGYDIVQAAHLRAGMTGQTLEDILTPDDYNKIGESMSRELEDRNVWIILMPAAVYRPSDQSASYYAFKGFESNPHWRLVFFNEKQKLYVDIRTPRGRELFEGIFDGTTIYPDDYHKNLIQAHSWLAYRSKESERKKGLGFAIEAFNLNPSPTPLLEILSFGSFRELNRDVDTFCKEYFDTFRGNQNIWAQQDGYRLRVEAARLSCIRLKQAARRRRNIKLVSLYNSKENQYLEKVGNIIENGRW